MRDDTVFGENGAGLIPGEDREEGGQPEDGEVGIVSGHGGVSGDITHAYLRDIQRIPQLSPQQEASLAREMKNGSASARERFISANLRLVVAIAKRFRWRCTASVSMIDLIQEGNIGLVKAVERFNPEAGFRFSTYATYWIRQLIENCLKNYARTVRSPVHIQNLRKRYDDTVEILRDELGRSPSTAEIAVAMGMRTSTVESFQNARHDAVSLSNGTGEDDEMELLDVIPDDRMRPDTALFEKEAGRSLSDLVNEVLEKLPHPQGAIIKLRFGFETEEMLSLDLTADRLGISVDKVRKYEGMAQNILRGKLFAARRQHW